MRRCILLVFIISTIFLGQLSHRTAPLGHCASGKVPISTREEWRSVSTGAGEPFVMTAGTAKMPPLCAENLATTPLVSVLITLLAIHGLIFLPLSLYLFTGRAFGLRANTVFGPGNGFIALDEVNCEGTESTLLSCRASERGSHDCSPNEDAGALCPCKKKSIYYCLLP